MKHLNFLSKSSSQSCGHSSVTLALTVGSPSAHRRATMLKLISVLVLVLTFGVGNVWGAATLPINYTFGGDTYPAGVSGEGVILQGYKSTHGNYRLKFDTDGDYIQIQVDAAAKVISVGIKKFGKSETSLAIKGSSDGNSYTTIETLSITGNQNTTQSASTTESISSSYRYFRIERTGGENFGFGTLSITKATVVVSYDIHWSINGVIVEDEKTSGKPSVPETVAELAVAETCGSKVFRGWSASPVTNGQCPDDLFSEQAETSLSHETTYYAVYAEEHQESIIIPESSKQYTADINYDQLTTGSYVSNNGDHSSIATASDESTTTMGWTSSNVQQGNSKFHFQSNSGYIYNKESLGTINSVSLSDNSGNFNIYTGTSSNPSTTTTGGYFKVKAKTVSGGPYVEKITVTFTKTIPASSQQVTTYSNYATTCCTELGQINGSVSLSQLDTPDPKRLKASWSWGDNPDMTGIDHSIIKIYNASNDGLAHTSGNIANNVTTYEVPANALTPCTEYYATITTIKDNNATTYCDGVEHGKSVTNVSTIGYTYTNSSTHVNLVADLPASTCANGGADVDIQFTAAAGYRLPTTDEEIEANVSVTNAGEKDEDWFCSVANNVLTISLSPSKATGTIDIKVDGIVTIVPEITVSTNEIDFDEVKKGAPTSTTFTVEGAHLSNNITLSSDEEAFMLSSYSLTQEGGSVELTTITLTANTTTAGDYAGTITISDGNEGASDKTINVYLTVLETYTVNWYVNGSLEHTQTDVANTDYDEVPSDFSAFDDCKDGLTFIGWSETAFGSTTSAPSLANIGSAISAANKDYYAVFAEGTPGSTTKLLNEDFAACEGTGGNDTQGWSGSIASNELPTSLKSTWTFSNSNAANGCAKCGAGSKLGTATTPELALTGAATLTFKAAAWNGNSESTNLKLSAEGATLKQNNATISSVTMTKAAWTSYTVDITGGNGEVTITFEGNGSSNARFFLDDVVVTQEVAPVWTKWYTTCPHYYTISLTNDGIVDGKGSFVADKASALAGESVKLTATGTENAGQFNSWSITGLDSYSATNNPLTITMPDNDITVSATFDALYTINKELVHGTFDLNKNYAIAGETVTISNVAADAQYKNPAITVFKTGDESATISVPAGVFTMPAYPVTVRVACEPAIEPLAAPVLGEATDATYQGVTLNWTGVAGNEGYVLTVQQGGVDVEGLVNVAIAQNATSYTIASGLAANTAYTYSIYTKGNGTTTMEVNTPANGNFSTEDYPTVKLFYSENGELSAGEDKQILTNFELAAPASDPCTKKFVGWSTVVVAETDVEPSMMQPGATYQIPTNENCTIYAVYATASMTTNWLDTELDDLTASDEFVLGSSEYAIPNNASGTPAVEAITVSAGAVTSTVSDNLRWNVSGNATDGYSFSPNGSTTTWLYCNTTADSKSNDNIRVGSGDRKVWELDGDGYLVTKDTYVDRYLSIFVNNSSEAQDFRGYITTGNGAFEAKFYKKTSSISSYSGYSTTCTGKVATPSFSGITDGETYEEDKTVSLGCATGEATIRYTMSNDGTTPADPTGESTAATSISLNADGVYVIKAKAFKDGMDASDVATISVTINKPCTTIAEFIAATPKSAKKLVFTAESNAVVLGVNTNRIYIQDPTGGLLLYKTAHEKTWTKGKKVVGTVIGTYAEVDNAPRMLVTDFGETVATIDGEIPSAVVIEGAINANFAANRNKLVTISDLHFQAQSVGGGNSINITRGDDTYQIYNAFNALNDHVLPLTETACSVTGILGYHSNKYQLMPIDANCITTGATAVLPEFVGETGGADAEHPTEVASGEVIKLTAAEGMTSNYTIGESAPVSITTNTEAVISGANNDLIAITISAEREYYTDNSVTYYYKINNALTKYIITSAVVENGTFKVKNSDASAEITSAVAGATVTLVAEPTHTETAQYSLDHWTVYETGNTSNTVSVENNQFIMPSFAVTVSATFAEDAYATVVFDGGDATGTAPAGGKKYVGQEVTMPNKGALVKANHVLASWTYNETEYAVGDTYEIQEGDAAIGGKNITFTANWTPYPWANGGDWMLVTNAAEVTAGSYVIIAAAASNVAMSTTQNNNNRAQQSISKNDNLLTYTTAPAIFEVRAGNIENTLAFYDVVNEGYIYAAGSGKSNHLRTEDDLSNNSSWIIEDITSAGVAEVEAQGTNTNNKLQHNSSSSLFSCYNDYSQSSIALYKYYAPVPKVTYDKNTEDEVTNMPNPSVQRAENNKAVIAAGPSRTGYTFEGWKNGNTTYTVGEEYTFTEDITLYAQWEALPSFHVTYNTSGSQGTTPTDATNYYEGDEVTLASASGLSNAGYFFDQWVATYVDNNSETQTLVIEDGKFTMPAFNVTVTATWARKSSDKWIKVTAISQLAADKEYIIVNTDATYAVGAQNTNNRAAAAIEENNGILTISDAVAKFTLGIPEAGKYTFENGGKYLYASSDTKNYLHERAENSDANGIWTINIGEEGAATVTATGTNTRNIMRYNPNNGSPVFSCYASSSSVQNPVVLYYKAPKIEINDSESVNVSDAAGSDIVIHEGGILTVDASASIGDLIVEAGGQVVLDANKLTVVGTFTIETTMASGKSGQLNGATASNFEAQEDAYIDITLGDNGNPEKWHAFTVPFPVDAINGIYDLDGNKLVNEVNYAIMDYHGDIRATGNYGWKKYRGVLVPGTFYLMTVDGERTTYRFKKTANGAIVAGNTKALYEYASSTDGNDNGWNGVGNPTLMYGTVDQNVQVLNPVSYTYEPYTAGNQNFVVGTPFFVQAASDGTMTMSAADGSKQYYAPARQAAKEIKNVKVTFGNEEYTDKLYISASEDALNEYETGKDLAKMTMTSTPKVAQIFGKAYNAKLCMVYAPMINDQAVYDLTLYAPANGEYTIAAPNVENADLYLTYEGSIIWDLTMGAYTNNFAKGNNEGYGLLLQAKMPMTPTGVDEVQSDKVQCTKVVIDEHVYILRGGEMYDVTGKAVK